MTSSSEPHEASTTQSPKDQSNAAPEIGDLPRAQKSLGRLAQSSRRGLRIRGDAPTQSMPIAGALRGTPYREPHVYAQVSQARTAEEAQLAAEQALDLAIRVGEVILRSGGSAGSAEEASVAVAAACGLARLEVDITLTALLMQTRVDDGDPITMLRVVRGVRPDYAWLASAHQLVVDLVRGRMAPDAARARLREVVRQERVWSHWVVSIAAGLISAGVSGGLGASMWAILVSFISGVLVDHLIRVLHVRGGIPIFYGSAAAGFLAVAMAWLAFTVTPLGPVQISARDYAFIVAGGIVTLLPSRTLSSSIEDIIRGYPITGSSRVVEVSLNMTGLIIGIGIGLGGVIKMSEVVGTSARQPQLEQLTGLGGSHALIAMLSAAVVGMGASVTMQARRRMLLPSALLGACALAISFGVHAVGLGVITATGVAAVCVGFSARVAALRLKAPAVVLMVPGTLGLMPGLAIFSGLYQLLLDPGDAGQGALSTVQGLDSVVTAVGTILIIATGTTLGDLLAAPTDRSSISQRRDVLAQTSRKRSTDRP